MSILLQNLVMQIDTTKPSVNHHTNNYVKYINQNLGKGLSYFVSIRIELHALYQYFEQRDLAI